MVYRELAQESSGIAETFNSKIYKSMRRRHGGRMIAVNKSIEEFFVRFVRSGSVLRPATAHPSSLVLVDLQFVVGFETREYGAP
jgi:hypothetical protein